MRLVIYSLCLLIILSGVALAAKNEITKIAYDASNNIEYIGKAHAGASGDLSPSGYWQIRKLTYDGSNNLTDVKWADGNEKADNSWANRAALTYE